MTHVHDISALVRHTQLLAVLSPSPLKPTQMSMATPCRCSGDRRDRRWQSGVSASARACTVNDAVMVPDLRPEYSSRVRGSL